MATALLAASTELAPTLNLSYHDSVVTLCLPPDALAVNSLRRTGAPHLAAAAPIALDDQVSCLLCCVAAALSARSSRSLAGLCWSLRLPHRAVRGGQVVACLRSSQCLAQLGGAGLPMLRRPPSLSPVAAVRHSLQRHRSR